MFKAAGLLVFVRAGNGRLSASDNNSVVPLDGVGVLNGLVGSAREPTTSEFCGRPLGNEEPAGTLKVTTVDNASEGPVVCTMKS